MSYRMLGFDLPLWWSTFIFILIWPPSCNNYISFSAYYSRLNRHRLNDKAWCCKQLRSPCTAPIYWCCNPVSTNILVLQTFKKSAHTGLFTTWWSVQFLADFFTIINYRTPCFLYGGHPTPSPVTGRDQWEFRGGRHSLYIRWDLAPLPPPPPSVSSTGDWSSERRETGQAWSRILTFIKRVPKYMSPRRNWDSPNPFSRQKVCPSPRT